MSKISSGIKTLDHMIDFLYVGDNVIWEVDAGTSYEFFMRSFIRQSFEESQNVIYVSFNKSPQSILNEIKTIINPKFFVLIDCFTSGKGKNDPTFLKFYKTPSEFNIVRSDNAQDIKTFTATLNNLEDSLPSGARYIFDSLTGMQDLWGDENNTYQFFTYMCPRLFDLGTVAYWILEKDAHSQKFKANLKHITQDVFEVYVRRDKQYIKALKLAGRRNREAFKPHVYEIEDMGIRIFSQKKESLPDLHDKIRELRLKSGLSQKDLADRMDVTPSFISQLENNQISPSLNSFIQLCKALDVNPARFFEDMRLAPFPKIFRRSDILSSLQPMEDGTRFYTIIDDEKTTVRAVTIPAGIVADAKFHMQETPEFIYVSRGTVAMTFEDRTEILSSGDSIYLKDVMPIKLMSEGGDEAELIVVW